MAQSKAIKKLAKILPIGDHRIQTAIATDDNLETGRTIDFKKMASDETGLIIEMNTDKDGIQHDLEAIQGLIAAAKNQKELDDVLPNIQKLSKNEQRIAKSDWLNIKKKIGSNADEAKPKKGEHPVTANEKPKQIDWSSEIKECGDIETLNALINEMSETELMEYSEQIDAQFDMLRT